MTKYILKFSKGERVKYVSHLDIVRVFSRSLRRAEIAVSHSQGFNPHPLMTFAHPLGVGIASNAELMELSLDEDLTPKELALRMNDAFPPGFQVYAAKKCLGKSPFSGLRYAEYQMNISGVFPEGIRPLADAETLILPKRSKSGVKDTDIKPFIKELSVMKETPEQIELKAVLKCGNENLKPELLVQAILTFAGAQVGDYDVVRTRLLDQEEQELVSF